MMIATYSPTATESVKTTSQVLHRYCHNTRATFCDYLEEHDLIGKDRHATTLTLHATGLEPLAYSSHTQHCHRGGIRTLDQCLI